MNGNKGTINTLFSPLSPRLWGDPRGPLLLGYLAVLLWRIQTAPCFKSGKWVPVIVHVEQFPILRSHNPDIPCVEGTTSTHMMGVM